MQCSGSTERSSRERDRLPNGVPLAIPEKNMGKRLALTNLLAAVLVPSVVASAELAPIQTVGINHNRAIVVNEKPFFPIMIWLQDPKNFASAQLAGINTIAGYWRGSGGTKDVADYLGLVEKAGFYGVMPFDGRLKASPALLAYIHGDEPDLPNLKSTTEIVPSKQLKINKNTPLWKIFDGVTHSWSVLDPLQGADFALRLNEPVEVESLAIWLTISKGLAAAKEISFIADGKEIARVTLENKKGQQKIDLKGPVRIKELSFRVHSVYPADNVWGSVSEIEGFDKDGKNVLLSPPQQIPRKWPAEVQKQYRDIKAADPSRPVFMTVTGYFLPFFKKWSEDERQNLYPDYVKATDVIGYDIYPIYGWNKPEWLHLVHDGTEALCGLAGGKPVYAWIETSRGGQYTGELERQIAVIPVHIRAEVWMAICRGATVIGYFTHVWKPAYRQFGVPPENVKAMKDINDQITRLAPAILSDPAKVDVGITLENQLRADIMAKEYDGDIYLFAVNYDSRQQGGRATIEVAGLRAGTRIEVVDEARTITATRGLFTDDFGPLGVHIYKIGTVLDGKRIIDTDLSE